MMVFIVLTKPSVRVTLVTEKLQKRKAPLKLVNVFYFMKTFCMELLLNLQCYTEMQTTQIHL